MLNLSISDLLQLIAILGLVAAVVYGVLKFVSDFFQRESTKRENYYKSFDTVVAQLSSDVKTSQLSAAILMRRYFKEIGNKKRADLHLEAINVISSLLKVLPTGVFQKTLGDGLAYAVNLSKIDLQNTNLQNLYLGRKDDTRIQMQETDMFMADLSYANLDKIDGQGAVFMNSILYHASIKNCDFTNAYFYGADLSNAYFKNVILHGADFSKASNLPIEFQGHLSEDNKFMSKEPITTPSTKQEGKVIFFSMPGSLSKQAEVITKDYRDFLEAKGYKVLYYEKDEYPEFGQFNKIRQSITNSSAMIAFGFKQINIKQGVLHPNTAAEVEIQDKYMSTSWNELEVGMGLMNKLPILLVKDKDIDSGVFDSKLSEAFVATITADYNSRELEYNQTLKNWLSTF
jgi:uncharacterized protein YjbI with pentapeptide repeats